MNIYINAYNKRKTDILSDMTVTEAAGYYLLQFPHCPEAKLEYDMMEHFISRVLGKQVLTILDAVRIGGI